MKIFYSMIFNVNLCGNGIGMRIPQENENYIHNTMIFAKENHEKLTQNIQYPIVPKYFFPYLKFNRQK